MTPDPTSLMGVLDDTNKDVDRSKQFNDTLPPRKYVYVWRNIILHFYLHCISLYGLYLAFTSAKFLTLIHVFVMLNLGTIGITCGAHRLWAHHSYKAKMPLKVLLVVLQTLAFQMSAIDWARDHRIHHKFTETDVDPYNARRGIFFSHIGWLLTRRHPDFIQKRKDLDFSDLTDDPLLKFQHEYYKYCMPFVAFFLPTVIPMFLWEETFVNAFVLNLMRYCMGLNIIWLVNSAAHCSGNRPYDKSMTASENLSVAYLALGEGWHNYHHTFPWDYRNRELGRYSTKMSTAFIELMGKIGWAYDMKTVSHKMVVRRAKRTGDGAHLLFGWSDEDLLPDDKHDVKVKAAQGADDGPRLLWGWNDNDLSPEDREDAILINRKDN